MTSSPGALSREGLRGNALGAFTYELTNCPVCDATGFDVHHVAHSPEGDLHFVRCQSCTAVYQRPRLDDRSLNMLFSSTAYASARKSGGRVYGYFDYLQGEAFRIRMARDRLRRLVPLFRPQKQLRILEVGCATGAFLVGARELGHAVHGIDVSEWFVNYGRRTYGLPITQGAIDEFETEQRFDLVCCWGAISSLRRPLESLRKIRALLAHDGIWTFNYPSSDSALSRILGKRFGMLKPSSVVIYNRRSIEFLLQRAGLHDILFHRRDTQRTNIEKIATFLKWRTPGIIADRLHLNGIDFNVPTPGIDWVAARSRDAGNGV